MKLWKSALPKAFAAVLIFTLLCGVMYPLLITGISQLFFKEKADGSIIEIEGVKYGSELLGQQFSGEEYLWGRIMNVNTEMLKNEDGDPTAYGVPSNLSPAGETYAKLVKERVRKIKEANPQMEEEKVPVDLVGIRQRTGSAYQCGRRLLPDSAAGRKKEQDRGRDTRCDR